MDRRSFLVSSAAALGASSSVFGSPSDTVRIACVGIGGRGAAHIGGYSKLANVEIAAICDPDDSHIAKGLAQIDKLGKKKPETYKDIRKLLEDKTIDAISISSPNHWHTLMTIWACQAGKDVYVEKPCSHNIFEAKQIVAAARKYNRMVQQGSQIRSAVGVQEAVQKMREGLIGDIYMARGLCFKWRADIGHKPVVPVSGGRGLRSVDRSFPHAPVHHEPLPLQLALVLGQPAMATSATRASTKWTWRAGAWA